MFRKTRKIIQVNMACLNFGKQFNFVEDQDLSSCFEENFIRIAEENVKSRNQLDEVLFFKMKGDIQNIINVVRADKCIVDHRLIDLASTLLHKGIEIGDSVQQTQFLFLVGDGSIGKTTSLIQFARETFHEDKKREVYVCQLKRNSEGVTESLLHKISNNNEVFIFVDNPYDNPDEFAGIAKCVLENKNFRIVTAERPNRLNLVWQKPELAFLGEVSKAIYIGKAENTGLSFAGKENVFCYEQTVEWRKQILNKVINAFAPDNAIEVDYLQEAIEKYVGYDFYKAAYHIGHDCGTHIDSAIPINADWEEWKALFIDYEGIQDAFRYIVALGLYKIPMTFGTLSSITGIEKSKLAELLVKVLVSPNGPVIINGDSLELKNDSTADLYFDVHGVSPQLCLEEIIEHLDEESVLLFEKIVFSMTYVVGKKDTPFEGIDTEKLLKVFNAKSDFLEILRENHRLYSIRAAELFFKGQRGDLTEKEFQDIFHDILENYKDEHNDESSLLNIWRGCIIQCLGFNYEPPSNFDEVTERMDYRVVTDNISGLRSFTRKNGFKIKTYNRIARRVLETVSEKHKTDIPSRLRLGEILENQGAVYDAEKVLLEATKIDAPSVHKACGAYAKFCERRAEQIQKNRSTYFYKKAKHVKASATNSKQSNGTAKANTHAISTKMNLASPHDNKATKEGAHEEKKKTSKKINMSGEDLKRYRRQADVYYKKAIMLANGEEKSVSLCAYASFLASRRSAGTDRTKEAKENYESALDYGGNDASAFKGLGMLYARPAKKSWYNPAQAIQYFEKAEALSSTNKKEMISVLIPWANTLHNIGRLDEAIQIYKKALRYKNEIKARASITAIETEKEEWSRFIFAEPQIIFDINDLFHAEKRHKEKNQYEKELLESTAYEKEILLAVYKCINKEDLCKEDVEACKNIINYYMKRNQIEKPYNITLTRVLQLLNRKCEALNIQPIIHNATLDEQVYKNRESFIKALRENVEI